MKMDDSRQLLADYVKNGSESAFRGLVARYINSVHSTALRLVDGDSHLAEDITQAVFVDLARKAHTLPREMLLGGWLHRDTCFVAGRTLRGERRRHFRERQALAMNTPEDHTAANLALVAPILDEAINELEADDRTAILLRFFDQLEFRAVGERMGSNEDAARMRVNRALDKLHVLLKNRGVAFSAAALGTALVAGFVSAAPLGLAATVAGTALASGAGGGVTTPILKFLTTGNLKIALVSTAVVAALALPLVIQHQSLAKLRGENQALQQQAAQLAPLQGENQRLSNLVARAKTGPVPSEQQVRELARLRGEVASLRQQTNGMAAAARPSQPDLTAGLRTVRNGGKTVFHNITMAEFAKYVGAVIQAPVADQTGLPGTYDIEMTPVTAVPSDRRLEIGRGILLTDLGLQLIPFAGPFTNNEGMFFSDIPSVMRRMQLLDGTWTNFPPANAASSPTTTNGSFAIRLDHSDAPGLQPGTGASASVAEGALLYDAETWGVPPMVANKLRLINAAKTQWASQRNGQDFVQPTWGDLRAFLGQGENGDMSAFPDSPEGVYIIGSVGQPAQFRVPTAADPGFGKLNSCINNLRLIDAAKMQWALDHDEENANAPTMEDLRPYLGRGAKGELPGCPGGGVYTIGKVGEKPTCNIPGHVLP
jgi:RNA polymerase sigma factor (sigma-70 family)